MIRLTVFSFVFLLLSSFPTPSQSQLFDYGGQLKRFLEQYERTCLEKNMSAETCKCLSDYIVKSEEGLIALTMEVRRKTKKVGDFDKFIKLHGELFDKYMEKSYRVTFMSGCTQDTELLQCLGSFGAYPTKNEKFYCDCITDQALIFSRKYFNENPNSDLATNGKLNENAVKFSQITTTQSHDYCSPLLEEDE